MKIVPPIGSLVKRPQYTPLTTELTKIMASLFELLAASMGSDSSFNGSDSGFASSGLLDLFASALSNIGGGGEDTVSKELVGKLQVALEEGKEFDFEPYESETLNKCYLYACGNIGCMCGTCPVEKIENRYEIVKALLNSGKVDPLHTTESGTTAALCLCYNAKDPESLKTLRFLVDEHKVPTNNKCNGANLLHIACKTGDVNFAKFLVEKQGVDPHELTDSGETSLMVATQKNTDLSVTRYLVEDCGVHIHAQNMNKDNCLSVACWLNPNPEIARYLIKEKKMDPNHVDKNGHNCLAATCLKNKNDLTARFLVDECEMSIDFVDPTGSNLLIITCKNNPNVSIAKYLVESGLSTDRTNAEGLNCYDAACKNQNTETVAYLGVTTDLPLKLVELGVPYSVFESMVNSCERLTRLNDILEEGFKTYKRSLMYALCEKVGESKLNPVISKLFQGDDVDVGALNLTLHNEQDPELYPDALFKSQGVTYYGKRTEMAKSLADLAKLLDDYK